MEPDAKPDMRLSAILAAAAMVLCAATAFWGYTLRPERALRWTFLAFFLPALWAWVELMQGGDREREHAAIRRWHRIVLGTTAAMLAVTAAAQLAVLSGKIDPSWTPTLVRGRGAMQGVALAVWGNFLPKLLSPWRLEDEPFDWQRVHRFCGWIATLTGIALVGVWLLLPLDAARPAAVALVVSCLVLAVGRKFVSVFTHSPDHQRTMP